MPRKTPFKLPLGIRSTEPRMYNVLVMTDDKTPDIFIAAIFMEMFGLSKPASQKMTLNLRENGEACLGVYSREIAEMKSFLANEVSRHEGHEITFLIKST